MAVAEEKRLHDAGGQLGQIGEPARSHNGQWHRGHFTGEVHGAGKVHGLGYVARVYGEVFHPVRVPEEVIPPQNIMLRWHMHVLMGSEFARAVLSSGVVLATQNLRQNVAVVGLFLFQVELYATNEKKMELK